MALGPLAQQIADLHAAAATATKSGKSTESLRTLHVTSAGPTRGLVDGAKSIYLNNTAAQDSAGNLQFAGSSFDSRTGTAAQTVIPGFEYVEADFTIGTQVTHSAPIIRTVSTGSIDAVRIVIQFPQGLKSYNDEGSSSAQAVTLDISRRPTGGTWETVFNDAVISANSAAQYEYQFLLARPSGTGTWDWRVERVTADNTSDRVIDQTNVARYTEIQDVQLSYPKNSLVSITYDTQNAQDIKKLTADQYGILCTVPSNYNPLTRTYSGLWDGAMSSTKQWTNNPVWILYEFLTNSDFGLGEHIDGLMIDAYDFYDASVYCDQLVPDGKGGTEPRFVFEFQFTQQEKCHTFLQNLAGTFNAKLYSGGGYIKLIQDRPFTGSYVTVTNKDAKDGTFEYTSSDLANRCNSVRVAYEDPDDPGKFSYIVEQDSTTPYNFNQAQVTALGCTSEGQARRAARYKLETELYTPRILSYTGKLDYALVQIGEVLLVMDRDYANSAQAAQIQSIVGTTVTLKSAVTVSSGTNTLYVVLADGSTESRTLTTAAGTYTTLTVGSAFSQAPHPEGSAIVSGSIKPQLFRVTDIKENKDGFYDITASQYDPEKYSRIENGISAPISNPYYDSSYKVVPNPVTGLTCVLGSSGSKDTIRRDISVAWIGNASTTKFHVRWQLSGQQEQLVQNITGNQFVIQNVSEGTYYISVFGVSKYGIASTAATIAYAVDFSGGNVTSVVIAPPTNLYVAGTTDTLFTGQDLVVTWTNPASNLAKNPGLKDFIVRVYDTSNNKLGQDFYVDAVPAGSTASFGYPYSQNLADGGPRRSVRLEVIARDGIGGLTTATTATFTNPAPAVLSGITLVPIIGGTKIVVATPTDPDYLGVITWRSTTSGFTPSTETKISEGPDNFMSDTGLAVGTTYYYKFAAYDAFGKSDDGTGLSVSSQFSSVPIGLDASDFTGTIALNQLSADTVDLLSLVPQTAAMAAQLDKNVDKISETVLAAVLNTNRIDGVIRDAGIVVDPTTGIVKISGVEQTNQTLSTVQTTLDAHTASINSKASVSYVDNVVSNLVLDPSQIPILDTINLRLSSAETNIDGLNASVTSKADLTTVNDQGARLTTAETDIDALQGQIVTKVENTTVTAIDARLSTAESTLSAVTGSSSVITELRSGQFNLDTLSNQQGEATLASVLNGWITAQDQNAQLAYAKSELYTKVDDTVSAEAAARQALAAKVAANASAISSLQLVSADGIGALATTLDELVVSNNANTTAITTEETARINGDAANGTLITNLTSTVNTKNKTYRQTTAPTSGMSAGDLWFDSDDNNKPYRYSGSAWVATDDLRIAANQASFNSQISTLTTQYTSLATSITDLTASVGANSSAITSEASTRAAADTTNANSITSLTSSMNGQFSTVNTSLSTLTTNTGTLLSQYTVKLDTNGYISGIDLASTAYNSTPSSLFRVRADKFQIASPSGPSIAPVTPFEVITTATTNNGQTVPVGTYMDAAFIKNGSIDWANIGNLVISTAGAIRSGQTAFNTGTGFWLGVDSGTPKFSIGNGTNGVTWNGSTLTVRGDVEATSVNGASGSFGTVTAGVLRNSSDTTNMNLNATGSSIVFRSGAYDGSTGHYPVEIRADGQAFFTKLITSGTWSGSVPVFIHTSVPNGEGGYDDVYTNGAEFYIPTGHYFPYGSMNARSFECKYTAGTASHGPGYAGAGICAYIFQFELEPARRTAMFTTGASPDQSTNPYGSGNETVFIKVTVKVFATDGVTPLAAGNNINITSLDWRMYYGV